jgi:hypothetical protein
MSQNFSVLAQTVWKWRQGNGNGNGNGVQGMNTENLLNFQFRDFFSYWVWF